MRKISQSVVFTEYDSIKELDSGDQTLLNKAEEAALSAYAPYSNFKVGAAILLESGEIVIGSNQENAAYPTGTCAERVALFSASANYPTSKMKTLAIVAKPLDVEMDEVLTPCGACRQAISEYEMNQESPIRIIMSSGTGKILTCDGIDSLLPLKFNAKNFSLGKPEQ